MRFFCLQKLLSHYSTYQPVRQDSDSHNPPVSYDTHHPGKARKCPGFEAEAHLKSYFINIL